MVSNETIDNFNFISCECGRAIEDHLGTDQDTSENLAPSLKWTRDKCAEENGPTDAYGYISFLGASEIVSPVIT